jgi:RNA polymerase sigma factor (sigma-70 family)
MRGDVDFTQLVDQHYASLYRFAVSLSGNETDGSDLVQETFHIWAVKGHQLEDPAKAKTWLFTTLHREFLARRRRIVRFPHHEIDEASSELPTVPPEMPGRADWTLVTECLSRVDQTFQAPVALFYLEDCSYNEIAGILEIPLGTVKSRIARGIAQLQRMLLQQHQSKHTAQPGQTT